MKTSVGLIIGNDTIVPYTLLSNKKLLKYDFLVQYNEQNLSEKDVYETMKKTRRENTNSMVKTAHPSIGVFQDLFKKGLNQFNSLMVIAFSSKLSGCYNAMIQAKKLLPLKVQKNVYIIDSQGGGPGTGLLASYAITLIEQQQSPEQIYTHLQQMVPHIHLFGMVEDPYWLQAGGRISPAVAMILTQMSKLGIRPLLGTKEGKIALLKVKMQAKDTVNSLLNYLQQEIQSVSAQHIQIILAHANNEVGMLQLQRQIQARKLGTIIGSGEISPVLGAHLGPGSLFLGWMNN